MKKIYLLLALTTVSFSSCSSDETTSVDEQTSLPTEQIRSYRMVPCVTGIISFNMPTDIPSNQLVIRTKRGNGEWKQLPTFSTVFTVQQNDSVWFEITKPDGYYANQNNYMDFQIYNKDTTKSDGANTRVRFETWNAPINAKLRMVFPEYY